MTSLLETRRWSVTKIISGGQTGSDRGGLEAANDLGLERGGWAPAGWRAEDGVIPVWYRTGMVEHWSPAYRPRTKANVVDSDGTLILSLGPLAKESGSMLTAQLARQLEKPYRHFTVDQAEGGYGADLIRAWLAEHRISVLNVAGPRESKEPGVQRAVRRVMVKLLRRASLAERRAAHEMQQRSLDERMQNLQDVIDDMADLQREKP